jgi:hypothetical protein
MKRNLNILLIAFASAALLLPELHAQDTVRNRQRTEQQQQFVDLDGDGYNDNAPDHDGDGIPNRLDPDWKGRNRGGNQPFADLNGDGVNDYLQEEEGEGSEQMQMKAGDEMGSSMKTQEQEQMRRGSKRKGRGGN